jgi:hypothetical protein
MRERPTNVAKWKSCYVPGHRVIQSHLQLVTLTRGRIALPTEHIHLSTSTAGSSMSHGLPGGHGPTASDAGSSNGERCRAEEAADENFAR